MCARVRACVRVRVCLYTHCKFVTKFRTPANASTPFLTTQFPHLSDIPTLTNYTDVLLAAQMNGYKHARYCAAVDVNKPLLCQLESYKFRGSG